jgi:hypothetical protein
MRGKRVKYSINWYKKEGFSSLEDSSYNKGEGRKFSILLTKILEKLRENQEIWQRIKGNSYTHL